MSQSRADAQAQADMEYNREPAVTPGEPTRQFCPDCGHKAHTGKACTAGSSALHDLPTCDCTASPTPTTDRATILATAADQCTRVKQELYKLRDMVVRIPHQEQREQAGAIWQAAYDQFQNLQTFLQSK